MTLSRAPFALIVLLRNTQRNFIKKRHPAQALSSCQQQLPPQS
jgi:hypothetical protein